MKWLSPKKISLLFFIGILVLNVFAINHQVFNTNIDTCEVEDIYTNPCAIAYVGDVPYEIEQDTDLTITSIDIYSIDFEFISLTQHAIAPTSTEHTLFYAQDNDPPDFIQLPRSHMAIS